MVGYGARYLAGDKDLTVLNYLTRLAGYTNVALVLQSIGFLLVIAMGDAIGTANLGAGILSLLTLAAGIIYGVGYTYSIVVGMADKTGLDKIYAAVLAEICVLICGVLLAGLYV